MRKNLLLILSSVVVCLFTTSNLFAQQYDEAELQGLRDFLIQESALPEGPYKNAQPYNYFCVSGTTVTNGDVAEDNANFGLLKGSDWNTNVSWITSLKGITWKSNRITEIEWSNLSATPVGGCGGTLDLSAADKLTSFVCDKSSLTELILNGTSLSKTVDVRNNELTKFDITNVPDNNDGYGPTLTLSGALYCTGNKLTFNSMPQIQAVKDIFNVYYPANQADATNSAGDELESQIDLRTNYYLDFSEKNDAYAPTNYVWKKADGTVITPASEDKGIFTFTDSKLENEEVYCEMTNNLFGFPGIDIDDNILTLKYKTTLLPKTPSTSISNPDAVSTTAYFSANTLYVSNSEVPVKSVSVFDLSGKQVFAGAFDNNQVTVDGSNWQKGVYIVKVTSGAGVFTQKVMRR